MKLNEHDIKHLDKFLNKELQYLETYNEMRDHILSALEQYPEGTHFETAFYEIVNTQFGGTFGLRAIDKQYRRSAVTQMRKRYFKLMAELFTFPSVMYVALVSIAAYLLFTYTSGNLLAHILVFIAVSNFPGIINAIRYVRSGYRYGTTKRSVADEGFKFIKYFPMVVYTIFSLYLWRVNFHPAEFMQTIKPWFVTMVFTAYFLHAIVFYKLYQEQFKPNMAGNY